MMLNRTMSIFFTKTRFLASCLVFSILAHILCLYAFRIFGTYNFSIPVSLSQAVEVDLAQPDQTTAPTVNAGEQAGSDTNEVDGDVKNEDPASTAGEENSPPAAKLEPHLSEPAPPSVPKNSTAAYGSSGATKINQPVASRQPAAANPPPHPLKSADEFLAAKYEKLTYVISMLGLPIGNAELEAKNEQGEVRITLRVKSNAAISSVFPVDDCIETRHIDGQFIMTKIKQQEGSFKSDTGFSINLRRKRVSCRFT